MLIAILLLLSIVSITVSLMGVVENTYNGYNAEMRNRYFFATVVSIAVFLFSYYNLVP